MEAITFLSTFMSANGKPMILVYALFGLAANIFADLVLKIRYTNSFQLNTIPKKLIRILRWVCVLVGMIALVFFNVPVHFALPFALLSVTAATDVEHRRLPWDWFLYGSVLVALLTSFLSGGLDTLAQAIIAQAVLYAFITFCVVILGQTMGGDIKVGMQYGSVCANLGLALNGMLLTSLLLMIPASIISLILLRKLPRRLPLAGYMWVSAFLAFILGGSYAFLAI